MMKKISNQIRDVIVILYEIAILIVPLFLLYLANNGIITPFVMALESFLLMLPKFICLGVFGDKPKAVVEKIIGY